MKRSTIYAHLLCLRECGPLSYIAWADHARARGIYTPRGTTIARRQKEGWAHAVTQILMQLGLVNRRVDATLLSSRSRAKLVFFLTEYGHEWIKMYEEESAKGTL